MKLISIINVATKIVMVMLIFFVCKNKRGLFIGTNYIFNRLFCRWDYIII